MKKRPPDKPDPFIEGMRIILIMRPDLNPTQVAVDAGLDNSTLRKLLSGENASPRMENAEKLAKAAGYSLAAVLAIGERGPESGLVSLLQKMEELDSKDLIDLDEYADFVIAKRQVRPPQPE